MVTTQNYEEMISKSVWCHYNTSLLRKPCP